MPEHLPTQCCQEFIAATVEHARRTAPRCTKTKPKSTEFTEFYFLYLSIIRLAQSGVQVPHGHIKPEIP